MKNQQIKQARISKVILSIIICFALALPLNGCIPTLPSNSNPKPADTDIQIPNDLAFDEFTDLLFAHEVITDSLTLNQLVENPEALKINVPQPSFGEFSFEQYQKDDDYYKAYLEVLNQYKPNDLSASQRLVYDQIKEILIITIDFEKYYYYFEPLKPSTGEQATLPLSLMEFNFRSQSDIDSYLELLADMPRHFEQLIAHEQEKQKQGLLMPLEAMQDAIKEAQNFTTEASEHVLTTSFNAKLSGDAEPFASLTPEQRQEYQNRNLAVVKDAVIPAYQQLYDGLTEISKSCKSGTNVASYKQGRDYYQLEMQALGFSESPTEAAKTLDTALDDYYDHMVGSSVSLDQAMTNLSKALKNVPDDAQGIMAFLQEHYSKDFPSLNSIDYQVKQAPKETPSDFALAFYIIPPVDNPNQNIIYYYPDNISEKTEFYTTLAHEGTPGHMYQTNYFAEQKATNIQKLLMCTAYMEGWAMYSQDASLYFLDMPAVNADVYAAYNDFMYGLQARIDIGVNFDGWDIDALRKYLTQWGMQDATEDLYTTAIKQPLAYLPYGLGVVEFNQLRVRAENSLGTGFDPVSFHRLILNNSGVQFKLLEANFENWVSAAAKDQKI